MEGDKGEISVSYPTSVEELIKVEIWYDVLLIERRDENSTREKLKALNEKQPIRIESTNLDVECRKLNITSTGSGVITYRGTADEVDIISTGRASIRTSELNK